MYTWRVLEGLAPSIGTSLSPAAQEEGRAILTPQDERARHKDTEGQQQFQQDRPAAAECSAASLRAYAAACSVEVFTPHL